MKISEVVFLITALILLVSNIFIWVSVSKNIVQIKEKLDSLSDRLSNIKAYQCLNPCE